MSYLHICSSFAYLFRKSKNTKRLFAFVSMSLSISIQHIREGVRNTIYIINSNPISLSF